MINSIDAALRGRLVADLEGMPALTRLMRRGAEVVEVPLQVRSYPAKPTASDIMTLASAGAVLTRYAGTPAYGDARSGGGLRVQDRLMSWEIICVSTCLLDDEQAASVWAMLDAAGTRLAGFVPDGAVGPVSLVRDDLLLEDQGVWQYGMVIAVPSQLVLEDVSVDVESPHSWDVMRRAFVGVMEDELTDYEVINGSVHPLIPDRLPGLCVYVEGDDAEDFEQSATERSVTLCADGYVSGGRPDGALSDILMMVESSIYNSVDDDGKYCDGTVIDLRFKSARREYSSVPFSHGKIMIRFSATYITEDE